MRLILIALLVLPMLGTQAMAASKAASIKLGPEGEILAWLIAGPFPNPGGPHPNCKGFDLDYLSSESTADPTEGDLAGKLNWKLAASEGPNGLDFVAALKSSKPAVAYAYAKLISPSDRDARLLLGSDDGVKVWLNGDLIHTNHVGRVVQRDEDKIDIRLKAGANRFLFKVDQGDGGWGLLARIANRDGSPVGDLTESLQVSPPSARAEFSPAANAIRSAVGKLGLLDLHAMADFMSRVNKADLWMPWLRGNPDKAKPLRKAIERSYSILEAMAQKEARSRAYADASDSIGEQFDAAWVIFKKRIQNPGALAKADPAKEDYIRVAPGGRYFVHSDGAPYTPIGYNHNLEWPKFIESAPGLREYDPAVTDRFCRKLHDSGVNLIRIMLEGPVIGQLMEDPVGSFRPEHIVWIDNIVSSARKHDIKLMITPWDTFWMNHRWDVNPYNAKNGGMVEKKLDFVTKREAIESEKKRWKYVIDRWGNTGTIFAWELLNEANLWWQGTPQQVQAWATEMGDFVREYEKRKWGRNHLISISISHAMPKNGWETPAFLMPGMDLATTHLYLDAANAPKEPIGPAVAIRKGVGYSLTNIKDSRPYIDGEDGPINRWITDQKLDDEVHHNMSWAHLASGGAGSGLRWPYRHPHHLSDGMYQTLFLMSRFAKEVPWAKLSQPTADIKISAPDGWTVCSTGTKKCAIAWATAPTPGKLDFTVKWPSGPATVTYRCYDTKTGVWIGKGTVASKQGELSIPVSGERASVAVVLQ